MPKCATRFRTPHGDNTFYIPCLGQDSGLSNIDFLKNATEAKLSKLRSIVQTTELGTFPFLNELTDDRVRYELEFYESRKLEAKWIELIKLFDRARQLNFILECPQLKCSAVAHLLDLVHNKLSGISSNFTDMFEGDQEYRFEIKLFGSPEAEAILLPDHRGMPGASEYQPPPLDIFNRRFGLSDLQVVEWEDESILKIDWQDSSRLRVIESLHRQYGPDQSIEDFLLTTDFEFEFHSDLVFF